MEHQKSEYFFADEPVEFLLLATALAAVTILGSAALLIASFL